MSSFTSLGVGSGIDLNSLLTSLMSAEKQPVTLLQNQQTTLRSQVSALGQIKSSLSALQTAADAIKNPANFAAYTASSADTSVVGVSASSGAIGGSYQIEVQSLAATQKLASTGFTSSFSTIPSGTLTIDLGKLDGSTYTADSKRQFSITVDSTNNTLAGLRDAINAKGGGVTATIVNDGSASPAHLVLSSSNGGTSNVVKLSGLSGFEYDPATATGSLTQQTAAADAKLVIDGISVTKSSNVVTDAIDGVTLTLTKKSAPGVATTVAIAKDATATAGKVQAFVDAYNKLNSTLRSVSAYNTDTKTGAALSGDYSVRSIQDQMRRAATSTVAGSPGGFNRLSDIGVTLQADGTLGVDSAKLKAALSDPTKDVAKLFSGASADGVASVVAATASKLLSTDGLVTTRTDGLTKSISDIDKQVERVNARLTAIEARYRAQFTALDAAMAKMNSTSSYLTTQLAKLG